MNIFISEMKAAGKSLIFWCIGMLFMVSAGMGKFSGFSSSSMSANELFAQMPKSIKIIFNLGYFDLSKASGFYGVLFMYIVIMAAVHASILGANVISKEESDKTAEFLYVKPVSRNRILTSKLLAALLNIVILNIVTLVSSLMIVGYFSKGEAVNNDIEILMLGMFMIQLIFLSIGFGIAAISKNPRSSASISTGILLVTYVLSIIIDLGKNLDFLRYLTPFKYYEAKNLMQDGKLDPAFLVLSIIIIAVMTGAAYLSYNKRDLNL